MVRVVELEVRGGHEHLEAIMLNSIDGARCAVCDNGHMREKATFPRSWDCDTCGYNLKYIKRVKE